MEQYLTQFITLAFAHLVVLITPGADFTLVATNSFLSSRRHGFITALGVTSGIAVHLTYTLFGIAALVAHSASLFFVVRWCGALYLAYLGIRLLIAKRSMIKVATETSKLSPRQPFIQGFFSNILNPNVLLFFVALFTQIVTPGTPFAIQLAYAIEILSVTFVWYMLIALLLSTPSLQKGGNNYFHHVGRFAGVALLGLSLKLGLY